jgi:hypothetical protein
MPKRLAAALAVAALAVPAAAQDRAADAEMRRIGSEATMSYLACHKAAGDVIARLRSIYASSLTPKPSDKASLETCVAKAKAEVEARIPVLNALTSGKPRARAYLRDWYEIWNGSLDRLNVDASGLREPDNRSPEIALKLDKVVSELRW